jgi:BON domain
MKPASVLHRAEHVLQLGAVAAGAALGGAAASYFMDPDLGQARRARLRAEVVKMARAELYKLGRAAVRSARDVLHDLGGQVQSRFHHPDPGPVEDDVTLALKVRDQALDQLGQPLLDGLIESIDGIIRLRGEVGSKAERAKVVRAVRQVDGVRGVIDLLHLRDENPSKDAAVVTLRRPAS